MTSREQYPWLQNSRALLIDAYWPPLNPKLEFDAEKLIQTAQNINANVIRFGTIGKYALVQNDFIPLHPELGERDLLTETINAVRGTDIKVTAYVAVGHGLPASLLHDQRPQWNLVMDDGMNQKGVRHFGGEPVVPVCTFGQYHDDILNFIRHIVNDYDIQSLYLDGPYYSWNMSTQKAVCQCDRCKKAFLAETGLKLPTNAELFSETEGNAELLEIFNNWVGQRLYKLLQDIIDIAKKNKNLAVMFNAFAAIARPEEWERKMLKITDGFLLETELGGLRGLGVGNYYDKIIWRYTQDHSAWPRCSTPYVEEQNKHSGYETLAWGGAPIISYGGRLCLDNSEQAPVAELFNFMKENESVLNNVHANKFIGIISEQQIDSIKESTKQGLAGAYNLLQSAGLQTGIVTSEALCDLEELQKYPVLFFPGDVYIGQNEADCLREYVRNGGTLIATGKASVFNKQFLLKDVFNVSLYEQKDTKLELLQFWKGVWDVYLKRKESNKLLPVKEFTWIESADNSQCLAEIVTGADSKQLVPAIVKNSFGRGRCFYINFPIERVYGELGEPEFVKIIADLVEELLSGKSPCKVNCGQQLYLSLKEKKNLKILFLYNPIAETKYFTTNIQLKTDTMPKKVYSLVSNKNIKHKVESGQTIINEHSFEDFECIAITF